MEAKTFKKLWVNPEKYAFYEIDRPLDTYCAIQLSIYSEEDIVVKDDNSKKPLWWFRLTGFQGKPHFTGIVSCDNCPYYSEDPDNKALICNAGRLGVMLK